MAIMRGLFLLIIMLHCVVTHGENDYLPRLIEEGYYTDLGNIPRKFEEISNNNHRIIALQVNYIMVNNKKLEQFKLMFGDRDVVNYGGVNTHAPKTLSVYKCFDKKVPKLSIYDFKSGEELARYALVLGYKHEPIFVNGNSSIDKDAKAIVLPLMDGVSKYSYTDYKCDVNKTFATIGELCYFTCKKGSGVGGVEAFACSRNGDELIELETTNLFDTTYSFKAANITDCVEEQDICIFSYVIDNKNQKKYYSSNYGKIPLKVYPKPKYSFVNAIVDDNVIYVFPEQTSFKIKNTSGNAVELNGKKLTNNQEAEFNQTSGDFTVNIKTIISDGVYTGQTTKKYKVEQLQPCEEIIDRCNAELTINRPQNLPSGFTVRLYISYRAVQGNPVLLSTDFGIKNKILRAPYVYTCSVQYYKNDDYLCQTNKVISLPKELTATATKKSDIIGCENNGNSAGSISIAVSGGTSPYTYFSDGGIQRGNVFEYTTKGNKAITITDADGCVASDTKEIVFKDSLRASIIPSGKNNGYDIKCNGETNKLTIKVEGGSGGYKWNNTTISDGYEIDKKAGTHTFTIMDSHGCSATDTITLTEPDALIVTAPDMVENDCDRDTNRKISVSVVGGVAPYTYTIKGSGELENTNLSYTISDEEFVFENLSFGTYNITVVDNNICSKSKSGIRVINNNYLNLDSIFIKNVACHGGGDGLIIVKPQFKPDFNGVFNYWLDENTAKEQTKKEQKKAIFQNQDAGSYKVKVQPCGSECVADTTIHVEQPTADLEYTITSVNCKTTISNDGVLKVVPRGGIIPYNIIIDGTEVFSDIKKSDTVFIKNRFPKNYTVKVKDGNSCETVPQEITIAKPNEDLSLSVVVTDVNCNGASTGKITAIAVGGWHEKGYRYTISSNNGKATDNAAGGKTFDNLPAGVYSVKVTDNMNVSKDTIVTIRQPAPLSVENIKVEDVKCKGDTNGKISVSITGGTGRYRMKDEKTNNLFYSDDDNCFVVEGLSSGSYRYTIMAPDSNCTIFFDTIVGTPAELNVFANSTKYSNFDIACHGGTGKIAVTATNGNKSYRFSIDGGELTTKEFGENDSCIFEGLSVGPHIVNCVDAKGCTDTANFELIQPTKLMIDSIVTLQPLCNDHNDGTITIKASGGIDIGNYRYSFSLGENTVIGDENEKTYTFSNQAGGKYNVIVKDLNNCSADTTITLRDPPKLIATVSGVNNNFCFGDELGSIKFTIAGGTKPYGYMLDGTAKVAFNEDTTICGLPAKNAYTIVVSDSNNCKDTLTQAITQPTEIKAESILNDYNGYNIRCHGGSDSVEIRISGGVGNYLTAINDSIYSGDTFKLDSLKANEYEYVVEDGNGCQKPFKLVMKQPEALEITDYFKPEDARCYNEASGRLSARIKGGVRNYVYEVTDTTGTEKDRRIANTVTYFYDKYAAGNYFFIVTDANNCVASKDFIIGQPEQITISLNKLKDVVCKGTNTGEVSAIVKGGIDTHPYSYLWNNGMTGQNIQRLPTGKYSVTVTDYNNCKSEINESGEKEEITVNEPDDSLAMLDPIYNNPTCSYYGNGKIMINVSGGWGGYIYALNGISHGENNEIDGLKDGKYLLMVTDANGCKVESDSIELKKPKELSFESTIGTIVCNGGTTDISITSASGGTEGNYLFSIDKGQTWQADSVFTDIKSGGYTLIMKDGNDCVFQKNDTVSQPTKLVLKDDVRHNYNSSTHQANGIISIMPEGGVAPYSYQWKDTTVIDSIMDNIGFGLYTIIVTDNLGCAETGTYYINDNSPNPEIVNALCPEGYDGSISFADSVSCTKVEWYNAHTEELLPQSNTRTISGLPKGIYKAKIFNGEQISYIYAEVTAPDSLTYEKIQRDIDCHGTNTGMAMVNLAGGVAPINVIWENSTGETISFSRRIEDLVTGKYTAYISDAANCQSSNMVLEYNITEPSEAFLLKESAHNDVRCFGNKDGIVLLRTVGNQGKVNYYKNDTALLSNVADSLQVGNYTFYAVDEKKCRTNLDVTIRQPEVLKAKAQTLLPIKCAGNTGSVEISVEGGTAPYSYKNLDGKNNYFNSYPIFNGLKTDNHAFVVRDNNYCYDTVKHLLIEPEPIVIVGSELKDEYCEHKDGSISIDVAGGTGQYDIEWAIFRKGKTVDGLSAGCYLVYVYDENRCTTNRSFFIYNISAPQISIKEIDSTTCYGGADGSAELDVVWGTGEIKYLWATDTTDNPYSDKLMAGQQNVIAIDELGCADTVQFTVNQPDSAEIAILVENPSCFNDNSGKLTASVTNYKTDFDFKWNNGVSGNTITDLYAGTYDVTVTNAKGCVSTKTAELVYPEKINIQKIKVYDTKCNEPNGKIVLTVNGGTGNLQYSIDSTDAVYSNVFSKLQSQNHLMTVMDENGCKTDTTIFVGANTPPKLVINSFENIKCHDDANGKVSVGVQGGLGPFVYNWNNWFRTTSFIYGLDVGDYRVQVVDMNGCTDSLGVTITEPYELEIYERDAIDPTCYGYSDGQIMAGVTGGTMPYFYKWGDRQNTALATKLAAGTHYLNVTDNNGCKAEKFFSLANPQPIIVDIPEVIDICSNQTADIDAGNEGSFYYWSATNGFESVARTICVNEQGSYNVLVTTPQGCMATGTTIVNVYDSKVKLNFLLQSEAYVGDTIVMIDISWPIPERIEWNCPDGMTIISDEGDEIEMVAEKEGIYDIGLTSFNDICTEQTYKSIVVSPRAQKPKEQRMMAVQKIIKSVNVYPNPVNGPFNLEIELNEEHDVTIEIVHVSGNLKAIRHMKGDRQYVLNFSNAELNAGIHTITITAGNERITKKIVVYK